MKKVQGAGQTSGYFGINVAMSNDANYAIIGAFGESDNWYSKRAVYTYRRNECGAWEFSQKLSLKMYVRGYGHSVAISNRYILIGSNPTERAYFYEGTNQSCSSS